MLLAVSAVLAMVAENRSVNAVLQELLKADGNGPRALRRATWSTQPAVALMCLSRVVAETYVRPSSRFVHEGECATFFDVIARARRLEEIAIGVITNGATPTHPKLSLDLRVCRYSRVDRSGWSLCATAVVWTAAEELQKLRAASFVPIRETPVLLCRLLAVTPVRRV